MQRLVTARPGAQQGRLLARRRQEDSCIVQVPLVPRERRTRHQQPQPGLTPPGMLVLHSLRGTASRQPPGPDPLGKPRPHLGALDADDRGVHVLPEQRRVTQMVVEDHLVTHELAVPFASKGFRGVHVGADLRREGHVELADKLREHPGPS